MKKSFILIPLLIAMLCILLVACTDNSAAPASPSQGPEPTTTPNPDALGLFTADVTYSFPPDQELYSYYEKSFEEYKEACDYYQKKGFTLYNENEKNGSHFATYTNGEKMVHIYWIECEEELSVILSPTTGKNLPVKEPAVTTGDVPTTVTQLKGTGEDSMGYIIQLADGSFIIYDGGPIDAAQEILDTLNSLKVTDEIIVRAWLLTYADNNHTGAFRKIAGSFADQLKVETVIVAPAEDKIANLLNKSYINGSVKYDVAKLDGCKLCYAHTGMDFTFCNVKLEILFTPEELYNCDPPRLTDDPIPYNKEEFNNTAMVSRIVTDKASVLFLSNVGVQSGRRIGMYYGNYLKSDVCQVAEYGKGDMPLYFYNLVEAPVLFCSTTTEIYNSDATNAAVRHTLAKIPSTDKLILLDSENTSICLDDGFSPAKENESITPSYEYTCHNGEKIEYFYGMTQEKLLEVFASYEADGYDKYSSHDAGGNLSATYTKGSRMVHIYWYKVEKRMAVVTSETGADNLPPKMPEVTTGNVETTVTQLKSVEINGMGYVVQLADGSFIIYDGGYQKDDITEELMDVLRSNTASGQDIIIRAWLITHPHGDHYGTFRSFADKYAKDVTLEYLLIAPITETERRPQANDSYLQHGVLDDIIKYEGAKICNVFPGMVFNFCNVKMEILETYHDAYILATVRGTSNNTCIVSRIFAEDRNILFLADAGMDQGEHMVIMYGDYLKSDMCQVSHHSVEDFPLIGYRHINAATLWYPCNSELYGWTNRDADVRLALRISKYTKECILHDKRETRPL